MKSGERPKAGLLPFYLKLYDDLLPECRAKFDGYVKRIVAQLQVERQ